MKKILFLLFFFGINVFAQESFKFKDYFNQEMLKEVYSDNYEKEYLNNVHRFKSVEKLINRIEYVNLKREKDEKFPLLSSMALFNKFNNKLKRDKKFVKEKFNVFKYNLDFFSNGTKAYRVDDSDWLIIIKSQNIE